MTTTRMFDPLPFKEPSAIRKDYLETFAYDGHPQQIEYTTKEFSAVCPYSGLPDIGTLIVNYIPSNQCLELKSFKYYLVSYRDVGIYQEPATNLIYHDLFEVLHPNYLKVTTIYNTRGGIDTTCTIESSPNPTIKGEAERKV